MRFILRNHQESACVRDTLRLFFSHLELSKDGFEGQIYQVSPPYQDLDLVVCSALSRTLSLDVLRGREEAPPVRVTTSLLSQGKLAEPGPGFLASEPEQPGALWQLSQVVPSYDVRRELKRQAYFALAELTGIAWPWGSLTGVRPSQVAAQILADLAEDGHQSASSLGETRPQPSRESGLSLAAEQILQEHFAVAPSKSQKLVQVAQAESRLLAQLPAEDYLVYLGVPFCPGRCAYCSFIAQDASRFAGDLTAYAQALAQEIKAVGQGLQGRGQVSALYMGGGTPTSLSAPDLELVLASARKYLPLRPEAAITVEAGRADTIDAAKLQVMRDQGVQRICLNPQTMHDQTLDRIGRRHTVAQVYAAFELARQAGFEDINMDLILGLPGEGPEELADSLDQVLALGADSVTIHSLAFKRSAYLFDQLQNLTQPAQGAKAGGLVSTSGSRPDSSHVPAGADLQARLFLPDPNWLRALSQAEEELEKRGYRPYYLYRQKQVISGLENTGYAREGKSCAYNVGMMSDQRQVIGLGAGSASKRLREGRLERLYNTKDLGEYMSDLGTIVDKKLQFFLS